MWTLTLLNQSSILQKAPIAQEHRARGPGCEGNVRQPAPSFDASQSVQNKASVRFFVAYFCD